MIRRAIVLLLAVPALLWGQIVPKDTVKLDTMNISIWGPIWKYDTLIPTRAARAATLQLLLPRDTHIETDHLVMKRMLFVIDSLQQELKRVKTCRISE